MRVIIDRFEGDYALCEKEDKKIIHIKREKIPTYAREGDALWIDKDKVIVDEYETKKRKREIEEMIEDLWE
ncbi:DUF3006 domain-containing protein [Crassaminicella thermophila]|uniref:DUF3006 domain-containing protein n=1 Tax=Crassaminicella thermophila TaxID=2599308 RepID=A0A5C0SCN6_CRATE|nr:DUF3006 domain-containing protein [Crassaminicella thermophila]QEK10964.1 DUF3006 domain-containing protein [Crassaminicella thermophila]